MRTISEQRYRDKAADISSDHSQQSYSSVRQAAHVGLSCRRVVVGDDLRGRENVIPFRVA